MIIVRYLFWLAIFLRKKSKAAKWLYCMADLCYIFVELIRFYPSSMWHHSALVRLAGSLKFGRHVSKICLPDSFNYFQAGKRCIVTGWGHTSWNGSSSPVLREAWVDLVGKDACNSARSVVFIKVYLGFECRMYYGDGRERSQLISRYGAMALWS